MHARKLGLWLGVLALMSPISCSRKHARKTSPLAEVSARGESAQQKDSDTALAPGVEVTEASLRGADFSQTPALQAIHFDYDSAALNDTALAQLKENAEFLEEYPEIEALAAGFCDERGTIEYNLALGQKRAKEVRDYYIRLGIPGKSIATISYGKEYPVCNQSTEECWAQNRRAETRIRTQSASKDKKSRKTQ